MSAHVFKLLNEFRIRDEMRGSPSILSLYRKAFDKFINTGTRIIDYIYHLTLKLP